MEQIIKRDGTKEKFSKKKIVNAIYRASLESVMGADKKLANKIATKIEQDYKDSSMEFSIEHIQDLVECELMDSDRKDIAKEYILYRIKRAEVRAKPWDMDELQKSIWDNKYEYEKEGFNGWIKRVSGNNKAIEKLIRQKKFLFGGRILASRGLGEYGKKVTYSNCYVLEAPNDSIEGIFDTAKKLARTFSYGGGVGIDISKLRPRGAVVNNSAETTSGAVSFMDLYSLTTEIIGQRGRRGALMISMDVNHPDIEEFIDIKTDLEKVTKANISIRVTDDFMNAVVNKELFDCTFYVEDSGETIIKTVDAYNLFKKFAKNNWDFAEPGVLFWDSIENNNLMSEDDTFKYAGTNPCAEEPLPAGGSCLLGSINLSEFVLNPFKEGACFDIERMSKAVRESVIALNDVLDEGLDLHPLEEQRESVGKYRQIGLGVMGIADMLIKLGVRYGSNESLELCDSIAKIILNESVKQSALIAKEKGSFSEFKYDKVSKSKFYIDNLDDVAKEMVEKYGLRNSQLLTIAPTGSISTMIGVSGGIEPMFNLSYVRKTESLHDEDVYYKVYTPIVKEYMKIHDITDEDDLPNFFVTAMNLSSVDRIKMQSVWQKYIDASISSTVNLPVEATVEDVLNIYVEAWKAGLKGITIFRDGCKRSGILLNEKPTEDEEDEVAVTEEIEEDNGKFVCPECGKEGVANTGGCSICLNCGYSGCS